LEDQATALRRQDRRRETGWRRVRPSVDHRRTSPCRRSVGSRTTTAT
jgi:hypothetical protein